MTSPLTFMLTDTETVAWDETTPPCDAFRAADYRPGCDAAAAWVISVICPCKTHRFLFCDEHKTLIMSVPRWQAHCCSEITGIHSVEPLR